MLYALLSRLNRLKRPNRLYLNHVRSQQSKQVGRIATVSQLISTSHADRITSKACYVSIVYHLNLGTKKSSRRVSTIEVVAAVST